MMKKRHHDGSREQIDEEEVIGRLRSGMDFLDELVPELPPSQQWLEARLNERHAAMRGSFLRDFCLFLLVAIGILSLMAAVLLRTPVLFLALQAAAILAVPAVAILMKRKRVAGDDT